MGQVVPFVARVRDSGDWTAAERARLQDLAERLHASGVKVDVVFGATDAGDPWCVVTDADGDVLIHVARIGGVFVVHSAIDDVVSEDADLHEALRDHMETAGAAAAQPSAIVLPFGLTARQGQTFLALVAASAFFYETLGDAPPAEAAEPAPAPPPDEPVPPPPLDHDAPVQDREVAAQATVLGDPQSDRALAAPVEAPAEDAGPSAPSAPEEQLPAAAPQAAHAAPIETALVVSDARHDAAPAPQVIHGTDGDDLLVGTAADERLEGGAGNDTLDGGGGHDTLDGGAGDDRIALTSEAVAIGGKGADTFVVQAPTQTGHPDTLLGVVLDFSNAEGDRLVTAQGRWIQVDFKDPPANGGEARRPDGGGSGQDGTGQEGTGQHGTGTTDAGFNGQMLTKTVSPVEAGDNGDLRTMGPSVMTTASTFVRVNVDLDGDGTYDGYVLVRRHDDTPPPSDSHPATTDPGPITADVGHALATAGDFGI